jgi:tetratricopeptide (TPR) repeat protein
MTPALNRAILLLHQSRFDLAAQELRGVLAESPHDPQAHGLLAVALAHLDQLDEAQAEAEQAIVLEPDWAFSHHCRAVVMQRRRRYAEAEASAREAVRLEPEDADYHAQLGAALFNQEKWQPALDAALEGLARDAEHDGCSHLRSMALTKLNRQDEALRAVDQSLSRDPDNAMAHANKGWALLHQREPRQALEHFREALRLDPMLEYARAGMVEALKAHNFIYRWMLAYFLWMSRLSSGARWGVILGGYFGYRILREIADQSPTLAPWLLPVLVIYVAFVALTWFAMPLFNLLLRLSRFGRHVLSRDQRVGANWFGLCLVTCVAAGSAAFFVDSEAPLVIAIVALGMAMPLSMCYMCDEGWPRQSMGWFTLGMGAVGALAIAGAALGQEWSAQVFMLFLFGVIATPWIANVLVQSRPTR